MKIKFISFNKTKEDWVADALEDYKGRLKRYIAFEMVELDSGKRSGESAVLNQRFEAEKLIAQLKQSDYLILLDERGDSFNSVSWSVWLSKRMANSSGDLVFASGGAYGFHESVYKRAQAQLSLSEMTFTHQMVKVVFVEQLYRAMTIMRNENYHHA